MSGGAAQVAVHFSGSVLSAVLVRGGDGRGVQVVSSLVAQRPDSIDAADGAAVGKWLAEQLDGAGMLSAARKGTLFGVARGEVAMKRIGVPPGASEAELPGLVRLQMVRQLPVAGDEAAIDFVPMYDKPGADGAGSTVLAAALPSERLRWREHVAAGAGIKLRRIGLLAEGTAWLLRQADGGRSGALLGVELGAGVAELAVVEQGRLVFARGIDVLRPRDPAEFEASAAALLVEARRTWMSYRVAQESSEIEGIVVLGTDEFAGQCARKLGDGLEMPSRTAGLPPAVGVPEAMSASDLASVMPLVGLLAQEGGEGLNFLEPRKPLNHAERRRKLGLVAALLAVLGTGSVYTWSRGELSARENELSELRTRQANTRNQYIAFLRNKARVEFLDKYLANKADWVAHLNLVTLQLPDPHQAVIEEISGTLSSRVAFELPKDGGKHYVSGKWKPVCEIRIDLAGSSKGRTVADDLRERFKTDSVYTVETRGADVPDHFDYVLTTGLGTPEVPALPSVAPQPAPEAAPAVAPTKPKQGPKPKAPAKEPKK